MLLMWALNSACVPGALDCADGTVRAPGLGGFDTEREAQRLVGLPKSAVESKLGVGQKRFSEWDVSYWLRHQGFCMDGVYLVIDYDYDSGLATEAQIVRD